MENIITRIDSLLAKVEETTKTTETKLGKLNEMRLQAVSIDMTNLSGCAEYLQVKGEMLSLMAEIDALNEMGRQYDEELESLSGLYLACMN